ncbi:MAG: hypothetical protein UY48_C0001G0002 [Candidatus Gottesmanbacteria bacterium GW2011_GWB1_49_7]|uniref:Uncharacterized protein n=1 Tax=Candidatus Gottesmanbacteria bacterium GW2011_GWB1_49_7 TaxID=1618448 RepID=A0A0G1W3N5_9BACT|nr:MAG: hypothetical protein UY48_C0001G0002 [Candidatus Gottesmanbacteria bacterium GW2011_GWB1_49_7]
MEETNTDGWGNLGEAERAEAMKLYASWLALSPSLRMYYNYKTRFYTVRPAVIVSFIAVSLILVGIASYFFDVSPIVAISLIVFGVIVGTLSVWTIERK